MSELVKRYVKGPKGIWARDEDGNPHCYGVGDEIMLTERTAHAKRRYLHTPEEFEAYNASEAAATKAALIEKKNVAKAQGQERKKQLKAEKADDS